MSSLSFPLLVQGGLVIVASQAWAEAAKSTIELFFTSPKDSARASIVYASILTILIIFVIFMVNYLSEQSQKITAVVVSKLQPDSDISDNSETIVDGSHYEYLDRIS